MFGSAKGRQQSRFDSYSVRNSVLVISHFTFWDCRVHIFSNNLSQNSCMQDVCHVTLVLWPLSVVQWRSIDLD